MSSPPRNRAIFFAVALTLPILALPGAALAGGSSESAGSEDSSAGAGADDGSVFCDPATLPEGAICSLTPDREEGESEASAPPPAGETSAERVPVSAADTAEGETGGETGGGAPPPRADDVASVTLARTGFRAWIAAVLGACLLLGAVGLLAAPRGGRLLR